LHTNGSRLKRRLPHPCQSLDAGVINCVNALPVTVASPTSGVLENGGESGWPSSSSTGAGRVIPVRNCIQCSTSAIGQHQAGPPMSPDSAVAWSENERIAATLISRVAAGDERALAQLYDATSRMVYGLCLRIVKDAAAAEDITLEAYLQLWRTAASYDPIRGTVSAWLLTVVRSRAIDWLRARKARRADLEQNLDEVFDLSDDRPSPESVSIESGRTRIIRDAMLELPAEQRRAIELTYFSGLSHSEIAVQTGLPLGTVKTRIRLGMMRLRELLGPYAEGL